jgi:hypothetical protein
MGLIDDLTRLDEAVLPRLGRGLSRLHRGATRVKLHPLVAAAGVLVVAVVATMVWHPDRPGGPVGSGPFFSIGVADGDSIPGYVAASRLELERLSGGPNAAQPIYALVSFSAYLRPEAVAAIAARGGSGLITIAGYARVPIAGRQTKVERLAAQRLPDDLASAMRMLAEQRARDVDDYRNQARAATDDGRRRLFESGAEIASVEAAAYRTGDCACVFALTVRAAPTVLAELATADAVRVVDAAPELTQLGENVTIRPPRPEQTGFAGPQPDDILDAP